MSKKLKDFLPKRTRAKNKKSLYLMVRFDNYPDLLEFVLERIKALETDKQNYLMALIRQDKEYGR